MFRSRPYPSAIALVLCGAACAPPALAALDLETVLRDVAASNPTLSARSAMVEAARRRVAPAGAWPAPILEVGVVNVPTSGRFDADPMTMTMIGASQRVPIFGAPGLARRAAREVANEESAAGEMARYEAFGLAWEAYADAWAALQMARVAQEHQSVMERLVQSARARYESGAGRLEDILRAQAEQARLRADWVAFQAEEQGARARLDALRGRTPGSTSDSFDAPPVPAMQAAADEWLSAVTPNHPRLREMGARASRYRFSARAVRRTAWPELELRGSYGWRRTLAATAHGGALEQDDMFSASVGFMLPIFAGASGRSEGAALEAMARASEAERRAAELELRQQVASAHAEAAARRRTMSLLADTVLTTQQRAVEASWSAYRAGTTDLWRVFESNHALYAEEIALARARQELAAAQARLVSLTGRTDLLGVALPVTGAPMGDSLRSKP
jgi:outer membrane protein, heavy metal efflux system